MTRKGKAVDLSKLDDAALDQEHAARRDALESARAKYQAHKGDPDVETYGQALWAARQAAGESQDELNRRHGAPPEQTIVN